jgi:hypothetical protein
MHSRKVTLRGILIWIAGWAFWLSLFRLDIAANSDDPAWGLLLSALFAINLCWPAGYFASGRRGVVVVFVLAIVFWLTFWLRFS